jgi:hypothetical protein
MKQLIRLLSFFIIFLLILFMWQEISDLSFSKKINSEKVSSFFTAISSILTAITVFLLYRQIEVQIEDRKASTKPDLYPADQFFTLTQDKILPNLTKAGSANLLNGLVSIYNIGFGAAKEIKIRWHFSQDILKNLIDATVCQLYKSLEKEDTHHFVLPNNKIEKQLPLMYISSLSYFKKCMD